MRKIALLLVSIALIGFTAAPAYAAKPASAGKGNPAYAGPIEVVKDGCTVTATVEAGEVLAVDHNYEGPFTARYTYRVAEGQPPLTVTVDLTEPDLISAVFTDMTNAYIEIDGTLTGEEIATFRDC